MLSEEAPRMSDTNEQPPLSWGKFRAGKPGCFAYVNWVSSWVLWYTDAAPWLRAVLRLAQFSFLWVGLWAAFTYATGKSERERVADDQRKATHYQAWQLLNSADGKAGDAGRSLALRDLDLDRVPLDFADFSDVYFKSNLVLIGGTTFSSALFRNSSFDGSRIAHASFRLANFEGAKFLSSTFTNCDFSYANLRGAKFYKADFSGSLFRSTDLRSTALALSSFVSARLDLPSIVEANFEYVNFAHADFSSMDNFTTAQSFKGCNLYGVKHTKTGVVDMLVRNYGAVVTNIVDFNEWQKWAVSQQQSP